MLELIFIGLYYTTSREICYGPRKQKLGLLAEATDLWRIETKTIWDGADPRLRRDQFCGTEPKGELLADLEQLKTFDQSARGIAVWWLFSRRPQLDRSNGYPCFSAGDALQSALQSGMVVAGKAVARLDRTLWRYCTVVCLEPAVNIAG